MLNLLAVIAGIMLAPLLAVIIVWLWGAGALSSHSAVWQVIGCVAVVVCMAVMAVVSYKEIIARQGRADAWHKPGPIVITGHIVKNTYRQYISSVFAPITPYLSVFWQQVMIASPLGKRGFWGHVHEKSGKN